jgi:hypothetical protein
MLTSRLPPAPPQWAVQHFSKLQSNQFSPPFSIDNVDGWCVLKTASSLKTHETPPSFVGG